MPTIMKTLVVAAALMSGAAATATIASAANGSAVSCMTGTLTPHGIWDCR